MIWIANLLVALVAVLHVYFLVLEMFLWTRPLGLKTFRNSPGKAAESAVLAANQGLYNGFLAAGLAWGLLHSAPAFAFQIKAFFLLCVIVAGVGAVTWRKFDHGSGGHCIAIPLPFIQYLRSDGVRNHRTRPTAR